MPTKRATIQYRYLNLQKLFPEFELKNIVVDVLRRAGKDDVDPIGQFASLRKKDLDQDGSFVVLNKISDEQNWDGPVFCGQLIHVKAGAELPGIDGSLEDKKTEFELQTLELGKTTQLVDGILYFAIVGNHVGLIEGQRTRGRSLERYLTRLLQDAAELQPGQMVTLNAKIEGAVGAVQQMTITPQRALAPHSQPGDDVIEHEAAEEE